MIHLDIENLSWALEPSPNICIYIFLATIVARNRKEMDTRIRRAIGGLNEVLHHQLKGPPTHGKYRF